MADHEMGGDQELSVKGGDTVQLVKEREDGQWWEDFFNSCMSYSNTLLSEGPQRDSNLKTHSDVSWATSESIDATEFFFFF